MEYRLRLQSASQDELEDLADASTVDNSLKKYESALSGAIPALCARTGAIVLPLDSQEAFFMAAASLKYAQNH